MLKKFRDFINVKKEYVLPPAASKEVVLKWLLRSFSEWDPEFPLFGRSLEEHRAQRDQAARELATQETSLQKILDKIISPEQTEWAVENAFTEVKSRLLDPEIGAMMVARDRQLSHTERKSTLKVHVDVTINDIEIPDPEKDEIVLYLTIYSGAHPQEILEYIAHQNILPAEQIEAIKTKWQLSDLRIGDTPEEAKALSDCLAVSISDTLEQQTQHLTYNIGYQTKLLWRNQHIVCRVRTRFNFNQFPFDENILAFQIELDKFMDISEAVLVPNPFSTETVMLGDLHPPRGYRLSWYTPKLEALAEIKNIGEIMNHTLRFGFALKRRTSAFLWRMFIPAMTIGALATLAAAFSIFGGLATESVLTQVIPGVLIATVALQLAGAQLVPPTAGRTRMDLLFVIIYGHLFLLYLALSLVPTPLAAVTFGVSTLLSGAVVSLVLWRLARFAS